MKSYNRLGSVFPLLVTITLFTAGLTATVEASGPIPCEQTFPTCFGLCPPGMVCRPGEGCLCVLRQPSSTPTTTPTETPTPTPTVTPTETKVPQGGSCTTPSQCSTTFCEDGVCCDTACTEPAEVCNLEDQEGICTLVSAPAPAASRTGLLATIVILLAVAAFALVRRREGRS